LLVFADGFWMGRALLTVVLYVALISLFLLQSIPSVQ
jgi:hypothetical protein